MLAQRLRAIVFCTLCWGAEFFPESIAQLITDGSLGPQLELQGPNYAIRPELGRQAGPNLFHSFRQFNIEHGETATFSGPASVQNVITRITGGNASRINGRIGSELRGANLFLLNSAGFLFGPDASFDVSGSVAIGATSHINFADGSQFSGDLSPGVTLTTAPIDAFGFLGSKSGDIQISGAGLRLSAGAELTLTAGEINIERSEIHVPGGTIALSADTTTIGNASRLDVGSQQPIPGRAAPIGSPFESARGGGRIAILSGELSLNGSALYDSAKDDAHSNDSGIYIRTSGTLAIENGSHIVTSTSGSGRGSDVLVDSAEIRIANGSLIKTATAESSGRSGDIQIKANHLSVLSGSELGSDSFGPGDSGDLSIRAGTIVVDSEGSPFETPVGSSSFSFADGGRAGNVAIQADELILKNRAGGGLVGVGSRTFGREPSGDVRIQASSILIDGGHSIGVVAGQPIAENTAIGSVNFTEQAGQSGNVHIRAGEIRLANLGIISAATFGRGNAGNIDVRADALLLDNSSIVSSAAPGSTGNGGHVQVSADRIDIRNRGGIAARTSGAGNAGNVTVDAGQVRLNFGAISADVMPGSTGRGGAIHVRADSLEIRDGGAIIGSTAGTGDAAQISVKSADLLIDGRNQSAPFSTASTAPTFFDTGIGSQTLLRDGAGRGGQIRVDAEYLRILGANGVISSESHGGNDGGGIEIQVGHLNLNDGGKISSAGFHLGTSGPIHINAGHSIHLSGDSTISAAARFGSAQAVVLSAGSEIRIHDSRVSAQAANDGGELHFKATKLISLASSRLISESGRHGGNILINGPTYAILNGSHLDASAVHGNGGNIEVRSAFFLSSSDSQLEVTSTLGVSGVITVLGPAIDLAGEIVALPSALLSSEPRLPEHCGVKIGDEFSSFTIRGVRELPWSASDWLFP